MLRQLVSFNQNVSEFQPVSTLYVPNYFAVFERRVDKLSSKAELGSSVVLNCPIESVPSASILWTFDNESNINFDTSER